MAEMRGRLVRLVGWGVRCRKLLFPEKSCPDPARVFAEGGMARKFAHVLKVGFQSVPNCARVTICRRLPISCNPQVAGGWGKILASWRRCVQR